MKLLLPALIVVALLAAAGWYVDDLERRVGTLEAQISAAPVGPPAIVTERSIVVTPAKTPGPSVDILGRPIAVTPGTPAHSSYCVAFSLDGEQHNRCLDEADCYGAALIGHPLPDSCR